MNTHLESISSTAHTYTIHLNGTLDGENTRDPVGYGAYTQAYEPNRSVCLENIGDTPVVNPWIVVNGQRDWRSIGHILAGILDEGMSDAEKARAIWEFARRHRYHYTSADDEVKDTVKMLNSYGYTLCWDEAYTVGNLWQAAGLTIQRGYPHGHCTTEVVFDNAVHLLDSDEHLLYLQRDNRTIASEADLGRDHDLVKRGHAYGILQAENRAADERAAALFLYTGPRSGGRLPMTSHTMDFTLRPGEALTWAWEDRGKYHGFGERPNMLANGRLRYAPALTDLRWAEQHHGWVADAAGCRPSLADREATLVCMLRSPYVMVGGQLELSFTCGAQDRLLLELSRDGRTWEPLPLDDTGKPQSLDLDPWFPPARPAVYEYRLRFRALGDPATLTLTQLSVDTDLQMAPLSLPALELGKNTIRYTADTQGQVRLTHLWEERFAEPAPQPPAAPCHPQPHAQVPGTQFTFSWPPVDGAADYWFQLGEQPDLRYTLSPVFDKLISRTPSQGQAAWRIPEEGLLNPGQTYYWRIRPRRRDGLWGAWSPIWTFVPQAPGIPLRLALEPDWQNRTLTLRWQPNPAGAPVDHWEIYGSDERGFTASREPYAVVTGSQATETFPANLLGVTRETSLQVVGAQCQAGNKAFYRVVAVDQQGRRSGPSDQAEAPRPMIVSQPAPQAIADQTYVYQLRAIAAIGDLRCESDGAQRYLSAFRDGDTLRFMLDEGPEWISLDERTGRFTACPSAAHIGAHTVTVRVQNGQGGVDMQGFDLQVVAPPGQA